MRSARCKRTALAKLTSGERNALPKSAFAGPGRSYPVNDASHARNAKARAAEEFARGNLSSAEKARIVRKADEILGET